jgi:hypothetical protein
MRRFVYRLGSEGCSAGTCRDRVGPSHHCNHWTWRIAVVLGAYAYTTRLFLFRSASPMDPYFLTPILNQACTS